MNDQVCSIVSYSLSTTAIEDRAQSLGIFETLKTIPEAFHEHMAKYVYPTIEGRDHQRLLYYFTLLENCACSEFVNSAIKPETHIRLLKKFKAVAPGMWRLNFFSCIFLSARVVHSFQYAGS